MKNSLLIITSLFFLIANPLKSQKEGWFNYGYELENNLGFEVNYYQSHIFPDSTLQVEYSSGFGNVWMHSLGQVFDPRSVYFDYGSVSMIENQAYQIDSIGFPYRYFRSQDTNPDTLIIQFFKQENIDTLFIDPWSGEVYLIGEVYRNK